MGIVYSNKDPRIELHHYLSKIKKNCIPCCVRVDRKVENSLIAGVHCFFPWNQQNTNCFILGQSTGNHRIEACLTYQQRAFTGGWILLQRSNKLG